MEIDIQDRDVRKAQIQSINEELGKTRKGLRTKLVEVCEHDGPVIRHALAQRLKAVTKELEILRISKERDLTEIERFQLPGLARLSNGQVGTGRSPAAREELQEQINPWVSLQMTLEDLISQFTFPDMSSAPK